MKKSRSPSLEKTTETRRKIVISALNEFIQLGFSAARISEISQNAGIAKGTVYSYFETKEKLFEGVIDYLIQETYHPLQSDELTDNETTYDFLLKSMLAMMENFESSGRSAIAHLILKESMHFPHIRNLYQEKIYSKNLDETVKLLHIAIQRKELSADIKPHDLAILIVAPIWMSLIHNLILQSPKTVQPMELFQENLKHIFISNAPNQ
jgi:AcrR family transcriptional regulator